MVESLGAPLWATPGFEHGLTASDYEEAGVRVLSGIESLFAAANAVREVCIELKETGFIKEKQYHSSVAAPRISGYLKTERWRGLGKKYSGG